MTALAGKTYRKSTQWDEKRAVRDVLAQAHSEGTVVRNEENGRRGVVVKVLRPGDKGQANLDFINDMIIRTGAGTTVHSNRYDVWVPVPEAEQTYEERVRSAEASYPGITWWHDDDGEPPESETLVWHLLFALLPEHHPLVTSDSAWMGDWPSTHFEMALEVARALDST